MPQLPAPRGKEAAEREESWREKQVDLYFQTKEG